MTYLTSSPHSHAVTFGEFRDFLLLLPRKVSTAEIYQYYEMKRYLGDDGRGVARVTMEGQYRTCFRHASVHVFTLGDVSLSAEDKPPEAPSSRALNLELPSNQEALSQVQGDDDELMFDDDDVDEEDAAHTFLGGHTALKFLLAGGIAGAGEVSFIPTSLLAFYLLCY